MNLSSDRPHSIHDVKMPFLAEALDPLRVQHQFRALLPHMTHYHLQTIEVVRHKPGRRCLIEYQWISDQHQSITLIGKIRAKGTDYHSYNLQASLWRSGFDKNSIDGISVPELMGVIPEWQMWIQHKVKGTIATELLTQANAIPLAERIAEVAHKLHQTSIASSHQHTMAKELQILHDRLSSLMQDHPAWKSRLQRILTACDQLGQQTPEPKQCGIHRDFYPDQIIVDGDRLYLLDLDLYCVGNPALDIGNFIGHIQEYSLRKLGHPDALRDREVALMNRFVQLAGEAFCPAIDAYTTLTLVRHIYISTQFGDRRPFTEALLQLCEQRLSIS
jgi:hypothetical protein